MAKDPAFLFYPGDYLRDTQMLSEKAQVAYDRIMCEHMRNICISQEQLNFLTKKLNEDEKNELSQVLIKTMDGYQIEWVGESIRKRRSYSESRSKNRTKKTKNISKHMNNICKHMENENVNENEDKNTLEGGMGGDWKSVKNNFQNADQWKYQFSTSKGISKQNLESLMQEFINDMELRNEYKDLKELQRHFTNWFNKSKNAKPTTKTQLRQSIINDRLRDLPSDEDLKAIGLL